MFRNLSVVMTVKSATPQPPILVNIEVSGKFELDTGAAVTIMSVSMSSSQALWT